RLDRLEGTAQDPGGVDKDIEPAAPLKRRSDQALHALLAGNVGFAEEAAGRGDELRRGGQTADGVAIGEDDARALGSEAAGSGAADAARRASDDRRPAGQHTHPIASAARRTAATASGSSAGPRCSMITHPRGQAA